MFELKKAKLRPQGMIVEYIGEANGKGPHPITEDAKMPVHGDLLESFGKLKLALVSAIGLNWVFKALQTDLMTKGNEVEAAEVLMPKLQEAYSNLTDCILVTGFSLSGEESSAGVIVTGVMTLKGKSVAINSPRIVFTHDTIGIESTIEMMVDEAIHEVEAYLLHGKVGEVAQEPNLFTEAPEPEEEPEEAEHAPTKATKKATPKKRGDLKNLKRA